MIGETFFPLHELSPYEIGRLVGFAFFGMMVLSIVTGAIFCLWMARRESRSSSCYVSLALVFLCLGIMFSSGIIVQLGILDLPWPVIITAAARLSGFALAISGVTLALSGLFSLKGTPHLKGRAPAVWALILGTLTGAAFSVGFSRDIYAVYQVNAPPGLAKSKGLDDVKGLKDLLALDVEPASKIYENEDLNIRFRKPSRPWIEMNPKMVNPDAILMFQQIDPRYSCFLIAERLGTDSEFTRDTLVEFSQGFMKGQKGTFHFSDVETRAKNGITYSVFRTRAENFAGLGKTIYYEHWMALQQGYGIQLFMSGSSPDQVALSAATEDMAGRLEFLDPDKTADQATPPVAPYKRDDLGLSIDLSQSGWNQFPDQEVDFGQAHFAATKGGVLSTGAIALELEGLDPDLDSLMTACLAAIFAQNHPNDTSDRKVFEKDGIQGISVKSFVKSEEGNYDYRFRVSRLKDRAWFTTAWSWNDQGDKSERLEEVLNAYQFSDVPDDAEKTEDPESVVEASAMILNQIGLNYYRKQTYAEGLPYYRKAFELVPTDGQYFENLVDACLKSKDYEMGLALLDETQSRFSESTNLWAYRGWLNRGLGEDGPARDSFAKAFQAGHEDESDLLEFVNLLVTLEEQEDGLEVLRDYRKQFPRASNDVERWQSSLLTQLDRNDEAISLLEDLYEKSPADSRIFSSLVSTQLESRKYNKALDHIEKAIASGGNSSYHYFLLGRAKLGLKSLQEAKSAFEKAQVLEPNDSEIKEYLDHTSAMLGKGNIASIKTAIDPVELPGEVKELVRKLVDQNGESLSGEYGGILLGRSRVFHFEVDKPITETRFTRVKITTTRGIDDYSTLRFRFDPLSESLFVNQILVHNTSGDVVGEGDVDDYYVIDENTDSLATTEKVLHVPVPGLEVGHTLTYELTRKEHAGSEVFDYVSVPMTSSYPNVGSVVVVTGDIQSVKMEESEGVEVLELENALVRYTEKPPRWHSEESQPWMQELMPWVWIGNQRDTWKSEGESYLEKIRHLVDEDEAEVSALLPGIIGAAQSNEEKIYAVSDFVQKSLSYQAIEFGKRGLIPNPAAMTLKNRYGDCKDHSLLIVKLLREAEIPAFLALASTGAPVRESLPSLDQFDHMVAYVPELKGKGAPFIDGTIDYFGGGWLAPQNLLTEKLLVLDPQDFRLEENVSPPGIVNHIETRRTVTIELESKKLFVKETATLRGYPSWWFRSYFKNNRKPEFTSLLSGFLASHGAPVIDQLTVKNLDGYRSDLIVEMTYSVPRHLFVRNEQVRIKVPGVWEHYFARVRQTGKRHNPYEVMHDLSMKSECKINIPEKFSIEKNAINRLTWKSDDKYSTWKIAASVPENGKSITIQAGFERYKGTHSAADFPGYAESCNQGLDTLIQQLNLVPLR